MLSKIFAVCLIIQYYPCMIGRLTLIGYESGVFQLRALVSNCTNCLENPENNIVIVLCSLYRCYMAAAAFSVFVFLRLSKKKLSECFGLLWNVNWLCTTFEIMRRFHEYGFHLYCWFCHPVFVRWLRLPTRLVNLLSFVDFTILEWIPWYPLALFAIVMNISGFWVSLRNRETLLFSALFSYLQNIEKYVGWYRQEEILTTWLHIEPKVPAKRKLMVCKGDQIFDIYVVFSC